MSSSAETSPVPVWSKFLGCLRVHKSQQTSSESIHGGRLTAEWMRCDSYLEENSNSQDCCKCEQKSCSDSKVEVLSDGGGGKCSFAHAVINMVGMLIGESANLKHIFHSKSFRFSHSGRKHLNLYILVDTGLGQLSTPYALENGGWASVVLLVLLGIICAYTSQLLGKSLEKNPKSRSYTDIGNHAYGPKGRALAATFIYLEIFMALVSYTISLHDNLGMIFQHVKLLPSWRLMSSSQLLTVIAILVALPSLWLRDLSSISFLSSGGILMSVVIFSSVLVTAIFGGVRSDHVIPALQIHNIPAISGLYIFSYAGHIVFPDLHVSMKDPAQFTKVYYICIYV